MPLEFGPAQPPLRLVRELRAGRLPAGSFTDDTEMALALAESLLAHHPLDGDDLARRFVDWFHSNPPDVGIHTAQVLRQVSRGVPWEQASRSAWQANPQNAGNGSVMRCWPVALACWQDWPRLLAESALQSRVTHTHPECVAGSVFINAMIALLIAGKSPAEALPEALAECAAPAHLRASILAAPQKRREELPSTGWVRHTVEAAVWGLFTTDSYVEAVVQVANLGNDADTSAAVTGALAGARYGLAAIPQAWQDQLQGAWPPGSDRRLGAADLIRLARSLAGL